MFLNLYNAIELPLDIFRTQNFHINETIHKMSMVNPVQKIKINIFIPFVQLLKSNFACTCKWSTWILQQHSLLWTKMHATTCILQSFLMMEGLKVSNYAFWYDFPLYALSHCSVTLKSWILQFSAKHKIPQFFVKKHTFMFCCFTLR